MTWWANKELLRFKSEIKSTKETADLTLAKTALTNLQFLVGKPAALFVFVQYASIAALEHLLEVARGKNDANTVK